MEDSPKYGFEHKKQKNMSPLDMLIDWIEGDIKLIPPSFIEELKRVEKENIVNTFNHAYFEAHENEWYYGSTIGEPGEIYYKDNFSSSE